MYRIELNLRLLKSLEKIPKRSYAKIIEKLNLLKKDPRPRWVEKLAARPGYRISVGNYRIIFEIDDTKKQITVLAINDRKDAYKKH